MREDPSDLPVAVPGRRFLLVVFTRHRRTPTPARALIAPKSKTLDYPMWHQ